MTNHSDTKCCLCFQTIQRTYVNWLIIFAVEVSSSSASSMTFTTTSSAASPYAGQFFPRYFTWPETTITERFKLTCFIWYLQKKKKNQTDSEFTNVEEMLLKTNDIWVSYVYPNIFRIQTVLAPCWIDTAVQIGSRSAHIKFIFISFCSYIISWVIAWMWKLQ